MTDTDKNAPKMNRLEFVVELADGEVHEIRVTNPSLVFFDRERKIRKWPSSEDAPMFWQTAIVWHALMKAGLYGGKFDQFTNDDCVQVQMIGEDQDVCPHCGERLDQDEPIEDPTPLDHELD